MSYRFVAETEHVASVSPEFQTREQALQFGRDHWGQIRRARPVQTMVVDQCGTSEVVWRHDATLSDIPVGYYAVDGKRYHLDRPEEGKWAGWMFITTGSDYHDRKTLASVRPNGTISRPHKVLYAIAADPFARASEYGSITGTCASCGRKLEDPESRRLGMGPKCRQKFGM